MCSHDLTALAMRVVGYHDILAQISLNTVDYKFFIYKLSIKHETQTTDGSDL